MVLVDRYLYGYNDQILTCLEFATGKLMWRDRSAGKGSVTYADGHLYIQGEGNVVGLVEATSGGYREKGRFGIPDKGLAKLGAPRDQRWPPLRAQPGHAAGVRRQGEVMNTDRCFRAIVVSTIVLCASSVAAQDPVLLTGSDDPIRG